MAKTVKIFQPGEAVLADSASDKAHGIESAAYRYRARMAELDRQYESKASEIRATFVAETSDVVVEE